MTTEFATMDAGEISLGYASGEFSPVDVTKALLSRIERLDRDLKAFYQVDPEIASSQARASEFRWHEREPLSPLDGVPTSIKDALPSRGHRSFRGSAAHSPQVIESEQDAPVVARMREGGMVFLGKTTMPDFGILPGSVSSMHGVTRNPWSQENSAGGSSAGAACSIASGMNPVAVGTDIVGSIRLPASFCGIFGFKPSQGRVPYYFPNSPSLVAGPMARTVDDAALLMNLISKPDERDFTALPSTIIDYVEVSKERLPVLRIAVAETVGFGVRSSDEVVSTFRSAVQSLDGRFSCERVEPHFTEADLAQAELFYKVRCRAEFLKFPQEMRARATTIATWSEDADSVSASRFYEAFAHLQSMREKTIRLMDGYDFLLLPTVPQPAFRADCAGFSPTELFQPWINTFLFNLSEQPASSVPCGYTNGGLPIGMQIVGRRFDDVGVFRLSRELEQVFPWKARLTQMLRDLPDPYPGRNTRDS
jgi:aspartyl-tRNA(Asn)/glutamyl-tRNA(Gln) amidotransferase subunit A